MVRPVLRVLGKLALLGAPLLVYCAFIVAIDPFDYFARFHLPQLVPQKSKEQVAGTLNEALWKVIQVDHGVGPNVLIGGSKMARITPEIVKRVTGQDYTSLAIGGAPVVEMVDLFWYATKHAELKNVVIGLSLDTVNKYGQKDRVAGAEATAKNPLLYLTNRDVFAAARNLVSATFFGGALVSDRPDMSRDEFWQHELTEWVDRRFKVFAFDDASYRKLQDIAAYCKDHGIALEILVLPNHKDIHDKIRALGMEEVWRESDAKLAALGGIDFDVDDENTADRTHFTDPFHFDETIAEKIVRRAWP
jgi:hypothetical protein